MGCVSRSSGGIQRCDDEGDVRVESRVSNVDMRVFDLKDIFALENSLQST